MLRRIATIAHDFFFAPIPSLGFGLMRASWAASNLFFFLCQAPDVVSYYSGEGYFPQSIIPTIVRSDYRFTLLDTITAPPAVVALYILFLLALTSMMIGFRPKLSTIVSVILLFSFQEHTFFMFAGGDTMMRVLGYILLLAPNVSAFSLDRFFAQRTHWAEHKTLLPPGSQPAWPYRLLLWQYIVVYVTAAWYKLLDPLWRQGSGVVVSLHDLEFTRWPLWAINLLTPGTGLANYLTILIQLSWALLLIPTPVRRALLPRRMHKYSLRRFLIYGCFLLHFGILVIMDAGIFSLAMFTGYFGLLLGEDFDVLRAHCNKKWKGQIVVLYDGSCSFCQNWITAFLVSDWLRRLHVVDLYDDVIRPQVAPDLKLEDLQRSMHVRFPDGRTLEGFDGVRALARHLPPFWIILPFLYLPGVAPVGRRVYDRVASRRSCKHLGLLKHA